MEFSAQIHFPAPPAAVAEMFATEAYVREKVTESGAIEGAVTIVGTAEGAFTVRTQRRLPTDDVPPAFRALVGAHLDVHLVEAWEPPGSDGGRHGTLSIEVVGAPVRVSGVLGLVDAPSGTTQRVAGDIRASVPLVGRAIERAVAGSVDRVIEVERRVGHRWLTR